MSRSAVPGRAARSAPRGGNLPSLTGIRAFAALAVFCYHISARWGIFHVPGASVGYTGVGLFFVLSGFVLAWSAKLPFETRTFYRRRFARIYPAYLVMVIAAAVLPVVQVGRSVLDATVNLLLVQSWDPHGGVTYTMNGVSWSLSDEAFFYAVLPLVIALMARNSRRLRWLVASSYWLLASVIVIVEHRHNAMFFFPPIRFGEFLLGVAAAWDLREGRRFGVRLWMPLALVIGGLGIARAVPYPVPDVVMALPFLALITAAAGADLAGPRGPLAWTWVVYGGEVSYCFYLVHELAIVNLRHLLPRAAGFELALLSLAVACAGAIVLHHAVELPCQRWLSRRRPEVQSPQLLLTDPVTTR